MNTTLKELAEVDESAFMNPRKLHLTVCMLRLFDKADEETARKIFEAALQKAKHHLVDGKLVVDIQVTLFLL